MQNEQQRQTAADKLTTPLSPNSKLKEKLQGKQKRERQILEEIPTKQFVVNPHNYPFNTQYNRPNYRGRIGEINLMPSMTVPEQSLSIRQILDRYSRGIPVNSTVRIPEFNGEEIPDFSKMDLVEKHQWIQEAKQAIQKMRHIEEEHKKGLLEKNKADLRAKQREEDRLEFEKEQLEKSKP